MGLLFILPVLLRLMLASTLTLLAGQAQSGCPTVTFQGAASASLRPSGSTHTVLLRQNDTSYTAFELTDVSPYRIVRTTRNFQKQLTGCPGLPVGGFSPSIQPPEVFTPLPSGGYLWVRRSDVNSTPGSYFALYVVVFDAALNLVSEAQYPILIVEAIAVADVNGDGIPDILTGTAFPHNTALQVLIGNGDSSFRTPVTYPISSSLNVQQVVLADLNGDGKLDAVVVANGKLSVFQGNGDGTFQPERIVSTAAGAAVAIGDLNRDGKPDLAFIGGNSSTYGPAASVMLGAGDGTFGAPATYAVGWTDSIAIGDMNGDGIPDVVTSGFTILFGDGTGRFPNRIDYWQETPGTLMVADFDGDGKNDIICGMGTAGALAGPSIAVLFGRGNGAFAGPPLTPVHGLPAPNNSVRYMAAADFDGDGTSDLLVEELSEIDVVKGNGDGTFRGSFSYTPANGYPAASAIADFNRDGKPDIVVAINGGSPRMEVMLGKGDGTFQTPVVAPAPTGSTAVAVGDFNGDGRPDVAALVTTIENGASDQLLIYSGDGAGGFAPPVSYPVSPRSDSIAVGDFNRDGKPDIAVASFGQAINAISSVGGGVSILFGKGDGTFAVPVPVPLGIDNPSMDCVVTADFNRDGILDLAATQNNGALMVLLGRGDGTFGTPAVYHTSQSRLLLIADLNGDGLPDLLGADWSTWLLGNGDGTFQPQVIFAPNAYPFLGAVAAADFNHDGKTDLAGGTFTTGVATLLNLSQAAPLTVVSAASFAAGPLAPASLATAFGSFGRVVTVTVDDAPAILLYQSAQQLNFVVPEGVPLGSSVVKVTGSAAAASAPVQIAPVAPATFTMNSAGLAAAYVVRVRQGIQTIESAGDPIDLGPPGDQVYLSLFGTGIRGAGAGQVSVSIQGINAPVAFAGAQGQFAGLDQVNVLLPRELAGTGDASMVVSAGATEAPTVHVIVK